MAILNNKINGFENMRKEDLNIFVQSHFFSNNHFLAMSFFNVFCEHFNCNFDDFIEFLDEQQIYDSEQIVETFFYY